MKSFSAFFIMMLSLLSMDLWALCDAPSNYEPHDGYNLAYGKHDSSAPYPGIRVEGNANFGGGNHFIGNVYATGTISIGSDAIIDGTLCAGGEITIGSRSTVSGNVDSGGAVTANSGVSVAGSINAVQDVTLKSHSIVGGNVDSGGAVTVESEQASVAGSINAVQDVTLNSWSTVGGNVDSGSYVTVKSHANVEGGINAEKDVLLGSASTVDGGIDAKGKVTLSSSNAKVTGGIRASLDIDLEYQSDVTGNVVSDADINLDNSARVVGKVSGVGNVTLGFNAEVTGRVSGIGSVILGQDSKVTGEVSGVGNVSLGYNAKVTGNVLSQKWVYLGQISTVGGDVCGFEGVDQHEKAHVTGSVTEGEECRIERTPPDFSKVIEQLENQCALIFPDPLQSHASNGRLDMEENTSVETDDPILTFAGEFNVHNNSCGRGVACRPSGTYSQSLSLVSIAKDNSSAIEVEVDSGKSVTLGDTSSQKAAYRGLLYDQITVEPGGELIFSSRPGEVFEINRLLVKGNAKVSFSAGQYAVYHADFEERLEVIPEVTTTGEGAVYFFTEDDLVFDASIASASDFTIVAPQDVDIELYKASPLHSRVYAGGKLIIDGDGALYGAFAAARTEVNVKVNQKITIYPENVCSAPPSADYYFEIDTLLDALTCEPHAVQVSVKNSADHSARSDYSGTISLTSAPSLGTWLLTGGAGQFNDNGSGNASYQFAQSDGGIADFALFNPVAGDLTVTVSDGSASASSGLISFRPYQLKGELSCVQTLNGHCLTIANKPFQLTLTAVGKHKASEACEVIEEYSGEKGLTFWSSYLNPSQPVGLQVEVQAAPEEWVAIAGNATQAGAQPVTFVGGVATVTVNYPDAGKIQIHVRDDAGIGSPPSDPGLSDELQGSASTVVNPLQLDMSNITGNKRNDSTALQSTVSNPATTAGGNGFIRASVPDYSALTVDTFDVTVQAVKYCADNRTSAHCASSYGKKTPSFRQDIRLNGSLFFPSANSVVSGNIHSKDGLTQSIGSADQGKITYADLAFDDVGTLGLSVLSSDYLGISDNDISSKKDSNDDYIVTRVGRFYPAYLAYGDHSFSAGCGDFTYMTAGAIDDTPLSGSAAILSYVLQAKAQIASGAVEKTTVNYDAGLNYPVAPSENFAHFAVSQGNNVELSSRLLPASYYDATQWHAGVYSVSALAMGLQKSLTSADGPYFATMPKGVIANDQLQYYIQLTGLDGEILQGSVASSCAEGICRLPEDEGESSLGDFAHGRLQASNGYGSELQSIRTVISATYFNGSEFVPLAADSCTPLLDEQLSANPSIDEHRRIAIGNSSTSVTILNSPLNEGKGYLQFSAPSSRGTFAYFLRLKGRVDNSLYSPWLLDTENAISCPDEVSSLDKCISGNLQFGLFRGNDRIIYRRQAFE